VVSNPSLWSLSHRLDGFAEYRERLAALDHVELANSAANYVLNDWCASVADNDTEKRLPYIGWYWRSVDFAGRSIPVGDCGDFIGFMENNKWDYPERDLTPDEAEHVIGLLWRARNEAGKGGLVSEANAARDKVLAELWDWMQDLTGLKEWDE